MLIAVDDDRARFLRRAEGHDLPAEGIRYLLVAGEIFARRVLVVVDPLPRLGIVDLRAGRKGDIGGEGKRECGEGGFLQCPAHGFAHPWMRAAFSATHFSA